MRRLAERLDGKRIAGFYTQEGSWRTTARKVIAHVDFAKTRRVSKYGVDVAAIDRAADAALAPRPGLELYLVVERMRRVLDSGVTVIATVAQRGAGFIGEVKKRRDCDLWTLTRANRDAMPEKILSWLATRPRARRS